ncbi:MAG: ferritin family protein [Bacteroidales bacterium]
METKTPTDILKMAILMEKRGKAFYSQVAQQTQDEEARRIFTYMAEEEQMHVEFLSKQFSFYEKNHKFDTNEYATSGADESVVQSVLNDGMKSTITAASFEAAAISAAIDFESKAIEYYTKMADQATDSNEKQMFEWLADWERGHHKVLFQMNQELMEKVWNDNQFWPF